MEKLVIPIFLCFLVWKGEDNIPEGVYSFAFLCVVAWSGNFVLQGEKSDNMYKSRIRREKKLKQNG